MPNKEPPKEHQFKPGQSGNPKGRKPGTKGLKATLMEALEVMSNIKDKSGKTLTFREALAAKTLQDAIKNDSQSRKLIWQYMEGMPSQSHIIDPDSPVMNATGFVIVTPRERMPEEEEETKPVKKPAKPKKKKS